jgi:hypothetical protein
MSFSSKHRSDYLNQADGQILASDGFLERLSGSSESFVGKFSEREIQGNLISVSTALDLNIVKVVVKPTCDLSPADILKIIGKCQVELGNFSLGGTVTGASLNFVESNFELSFVLDGDT